jgi:hypothetical protein
MPTLTSTDLQVTQGKLNGHLKSEDFFGTENSTSTLVFKTVAAKGKTYML